MVDKVFAPKASFGNIFLLERIFKLDQKHFLTFDETRKLSRGKLKLDRKLNALEDFSLKYVSVKRWTVNISSPYRKPRKNYSIFNQKTHNQRQSYFN